MRCASCDAENPSTNKFCGECGAALVAVCAACGERNPPSNRFCGECGARLGAGAGGSGPPSTAAPEPAVAQPTPRSYTPGHLADRILEGRASLEGERKQVTVLFADVVGSTELIRDLDPEDARSLLEPAVSAMLSAVHRFEGTVCRVMGDGIMALFGAPLAHEDHAARACYAALTMQEAIRAYGGELRERHGLEVLARVGLNSGEVVVGAISNDLYVEYSAIGPTTHLAARMEQLAVPGTVRLTAETLRLVDGLVETSALGRIPVKGLDQPVAAYELVGAGPSRRRLQAAAGRGLTPFVGREAELDALGRALERARNGQGQIVAPVGEPGVGKSRLLYEFVHSQRTAGWLVLESGSVSYGKATSYLPVIDLLKGYCRIEPRDDPRTVREKLTGKVLALDPSLAAILPPLLALLDLPVEDETWTALDPSGRRRATLDALRRLLLRESREQPLLLVFEDLHWIDAETQALLDSLVEALPTARILLLVNFRPEYSHTWGNKSFYTQLRIDPLGQESASELLDALLGDDAAVKRLAELLIARTEGNPFFLEESVRALAETGALVGERGGFTLARPVESLQVPATVQAVLAARIDRLPPEEKRLLQTAAVIGKDVPFALLQAIADTPDAALQAGLSRLQAGELLYAVSLFPELELTFKHALTHEVAYGGLLQERRRVLHARIVEAMEALYPDRLDEHVERLTHHAVRGQVWEKLIEYARIAGSRAMSRSAGDEAVHFFEAALQGLDRLESSPDRMALGIDVHIALCGAYSAVHRFDHSRESARQAVALAETTGDRQRLGRALTCQAHYLRSAVDHRQAVETGERAIAIADELGDLELRLAAADVAGASSFETGQFGRAIGHLRSSLNVLASEGAVENFGHHIPAAMHARTYLAFALAWSGDFDASMDAIEEQGKIAALMGHPESNKLANDTRGLVSALRGDVAGATVLLEQSLAICRQIGIEPVAMSSLAFTGHAYALGGRPDDAVDSLRRSLHLADVTRHMPCASLWQGWLAQALLGAGALDDAETAGVRAVEMARASQERGFEAEAHYWLGEVVLQTEPLDADRAARLFGAALAIAEELGMRPLQAHIHRSLGKLYRRTGRRHEARSELNVAIDLYLSMGMTHWLPEAEAELAALPD